MFWMTLFYDALLMTSFLNVAIFRHLILICHTLRHLGCLKTLTFFFSSTVFLHELNVLDSTLFISSFQLECPS